MRKMFLSCIFISFVLLSNGQSLDLNVYRKDFNKGVKDETLCKTYYETLKKNSNSHVEKGYEAAFQMFMAKHTGNPIKKMSYFKGGRGLLEEQIKTSPFNIELRFIRLCIQYYIPSYLGYKANIKEDKDFLMNNLYKFQDEEGKLFLYNHLKGADMYTDQELILLGR